MKHCEKIRELIDEDKEPSEKLPKQVLKENETLLLELFQLKNISELINSDYRYKVEQLYFSYPEVQTAEDAKKYLALYRVWLLLRIEDTKKILKFKKYQNPDYKPLEAINALARYRNELRNCEHTLLKFDNVTDWRHSMKSAAGQNIRHKAKNQLYDDACVLAEKLWSEGDECIRHQMAKVIIELKDYSSLSFRTLQDKLTPIAEKYGRNYDPQKPRKPE